MTALGGAGRVHRSGHDGTTAAAVLAGAVVAVLGGVGMAQDAHVSLEVSGALVALAAAVWLIRRYGSGALVALLVLGAVDALPGPNLETLGVVRTAMASDVLVLVLAVALVAIAVREGTIRASVSVHETVLRACSAALLALWVIAAMRAWLVHAVPFFNGLFWGREYMFLAILPPLFARVLVIERVRVTTMAVCAVGLCVTALGQVVTVVTGRNINLLVHLTQVGDVQGLIRLYSGADWLIPAGVPFGIGLLLFSSTRRQRTVGGVLLIFSVTAVAVELTRALYVGLVVGIALTTALWLLVGDPTGRIGRRRGLRVLAVLLAMGAALVFFKPAVVTGSAVNGVAVRATSVFSDLSGNAQDPDLEARVIERSDMEWYLGGSWLFGKGFLDPTFYFVPQVVNGSIMNPDVGYLSAVMTIGVVGAIAVYLPFIYLAVALGVLRLRRRLEPGWVSYGSLAWILASLVSSVTVAVMISPIGAVVSGAILALGCICADQARPDEAEEPVAPAPAARSLTAWSA